jgi:5-oxopent-3-ene-1,2,5-tricarboxylate decarboxylase/2-hydroxyhepta-2,4-diene-1,7-dioate isomerase
MSFPAPLEFSTVPWRLSGVVYGTLLNHAPSLQALGDAVDAAPYKGAPRAPVLYVKPRNTRNVHGGSVPVPADVDALEVGASLGIVIGQTACRVQAHSALDHVAGYTIVADVCIPHTVYYRPSIRLRARDGFCPIGPTVVARDAIANPDHLRVQTFIDGVLQHDSHTGERIRNVRQLIADVSEFMTLLPGDVLLLGSAAHPAMAAAGQCSRIEIEDLGALENHFVKEGNKA